MTLPIDLRLVGIKTKNLKCFEDWVRPRFLLAFTTVQLDSKPFPIVKRQGFSNVRSTEVPWSS